MKKRIVITSIFILVLGLLFFGCASEPAQKPAVEKVSEKVTVQERRPLSVILYNWIPDLDEYFNTMETDFEALHKDIDLQIISLPGYYDGLDTTEADVYEVDEFGLRTLLYADRLQPLVEAEVPGPEDFFPICKGVANIDGQWWGIPHWTCTNFLFYHKDDTELAGVKTFSELEKVIGGKDHPTGEGLLIDMMGTYRTRELYKDTLMDLYPDDPETLYAYLDENNVSDKAIAVEKRIIDMMDPGMGRNPQNDKIFDYLQRQFMYGNGRAFMYYSEAIGYFYKIIEDAMGYGDTTLSLDDIAVMPFV